MPDPAVRRRKLLSFVLLITGIAFIGVYGLMTVFPESWAWEPRQYEYEQMIAGVYAVLGIFLLLAARAPERHLSLIWFTAASSLVHGLIMLVQALVDPAETPNLYGDIPALILVGILLAVLAPKRLT
ncbi:MAG: DUF6632 domain-containing protein [Alphaproteobacteria bacterium]